MLLAMRSIAAVRRPYGRLPADPLWSVWSYIFSIVTGKMDGVVGMMILWLNRKNFMCPPGLPANVLCGMPTQSPSITASAGGDSVIVPLKTFANAKHCPEEQ